MSNLSTIAKIAAHFDGQINGFDRMDLVMDIDAVNDINPLNLEAMVNDLDSLHVAHDVLGIAKNFDRKTKTLVNGWTPRFTLPHMNTKTLAIGTFNDKKAREYISELIYEELVEREIDFSSYSFSIEVTYVEGEEL